MVKIKNFSRPLSDFQVDFKANLTFKDFIRQSGIFKYFSRLCELCRSWTEDGQKKVDGKKNGGQ